ncbi:MAG TPA: hypothetical protein PKH54_12965 [Myxococcota bacterium]|nr:hypothetical protein [Myxococcota bacterium]HOD00851.1 hypothetical protein [Myxococcota bacterium]HOH75634.1 hypothetical protein [Myxococcota bacterium]
MNTKSFVVMAGTVFLCVLCSTGCGGSNQPAVDATTIDVHADSIGSDLIDDSTPADTRQDTSGTDPGAADHGSEIAPDNGITDPGNADNGSDDIPLDGEFVILAWNNLGMHCYNPSFKRLAVLPPFNTIWAQVYRKAPSPELITSGITIEYSYPDNSYSAAGTPAKSDFWEYAEQLFGSPLATDVGLTGKGLTGTFELKTDHWEAEGIPVTEFRDRDATVGGSPLTWNRYPYQLATVVVKRTSDGTELARSRVVTPVSSELNCQTCHSDSGAATVKYPITPSGTDDTDLNILRLHDYLAKTDHESNQPVLCAKCHASNALGTLGNMGVPNLSKAIHSRHRDIKEISEDTTGCYACHPGPETKCLRDVMTREGSVAGCVACHGNMAAVATNPTPWINEPRCDSAQCHGGEVRQDKPLYNMSKGHHGVYCAACHDSPHAIAPSREANDGIKFMELQDGEGPVKDCTLCHGFKPSGEIHEEDD